jgi:hypothetical protein
MSLCRAGDKDQLEVEISRIREDVRYVEFRAIGAAPGEVTRHELHTARAGWPAARRDASWPDFPLALILNFRLRMRS